MKSVICSFIDKINQFNTLAGRNYSEDPDSLQFANDMKNQTARVLEECKELLEAIEYNDKEGIIDGVVDILFTALPLAEISFNAGYKVEPACMEVANNNLTKFPTSYSVAKKSVEKKYGENEARVETVVYGGVTYYPVIRNEDNKLLKPIGYESVNLSKYVPMEEK